MSKMMDLVNEAMVRMSTREEGQGMVEYGLIIVLVALAVIVGITALGTTVSAVFQNTTANL